LAYEFSKIEVLIADSQPMVVDLIRATMRLLGVPPENLHSFYDGASALTSFKKVNHDLIIVDWELQDIKGLEFIKAIRSNPVNPYVPVIFTTALTTAKRVGEARDSGITEFLAKPFTARTLAERIEVIVERPRQFVLAPDYRGPDRRRKTGADYTGPERRGAQKDLVISETDVFKGQKKVRDAQFLTPPNVMKQKVGSGGVATEALAKAEEYIEKNTTNFKPAGIALVDALTEALRNTRNGGMKSDTAIEFMLYPAVRLKSQGALFHYPLISKISEILVNFLETIETTDEDVFEIVEAHRVAFMYVLNNDINGMGGPQEKTLLGDLLDACGRYYKTRNIKQA